MKEYMNVPLSGGDEYDALTKSKRFFRWQAGVRKEIKRGYNKRNRKNARRHIEDEYLAEKHYLSGVY